LNDEGDGQGVAGSEDRLVPLRKVIEIALYENGAESAEAYNLRSGLDRAGRGASNASDVLMHVRGF